MPLLSDLLRSISLSLQPAKNLESTHISGLTCDSKAVEKNSIFFALKGVKIDGYDFIPQALSNGAVLAFCEKSYHPDTKNPHIIPLENPRLALAQMAAAFYGKQPGHLVAITGTDGKTSTADFFRQLSFLSGKAAASMGTLGVLSGEGETLYPGTLTTPDPIAIHKILAEMADKNIQHVALEASSHGLHQHRLSGLKLEAAAFTNIGRDHLDYHHTEDEYFIAKSRLFTELLPAGKTAVLNQDDMRFATLQKICKTRGHQVIGFGKNGAEFKVKNITPHGHGQTVSAELFGKGYDIEVPLVGGFQVMNILAALGLMVRVGPKLEDLLMLIPKLKGVPGRLEQVVATKAGASVFIDYAHTPLALANILNTLRPHTMGKLHVVFGCGGDRDAGKRPQMGKIAAELADHVIVTDDNPRSEVPAEIRRQIFAGIERKEICKEVADRAQAIYRALSELNAGDILVIAGKGHEKYQLIAGVEHPFDDAEVARQAAAKLGIAA